MFIHPPRPVHSQPPPLPYLPDGRLALPYLPELNGLRGLWFFSAMVTTPSTLVDLLDLASTSCV